MLIGIQKERLFRDCKQEAKRLGSINFPIELDLDAALSIIGNLQLALRHPNNTGTPAQVAQRFVSGLIDRIRAAGYIHNATLAELGGSREYDDTRRGDDQRTN